mgnify:CR=1 FL=1
MKKWLLRKKLLDLIKSWPVLLAVILLSSLAGWGIMHFWSPPPRAAVDIYIGIDINRVMDVSSLAVYAKTEPFNIDDYKNWQLSQVKAIATSEAIADQTLKRLRERDPAWEEITPSEFQRMQDLSWYDIGQWRLQIKAPEKEQAVQGVLAWRDVLVSELHSLTEKGEEMFHLDGQLRALDSAIVEYQARNLDLNLLLDQIESFTSRINDSSQSTGGPAPGFRDEILVMVTDFARSTPAWQRLLDSFPEPKGGWAAYLDWLEKTARTGRTELENNLKLIEELEADYQETFAEHLQKVKQARGLSPTLIVEAHQSQVNISRHYPDGVIILLSGVLGTLIYLIIWLMWDENRGDQ